MWDNYCYKLYKIEISHDWYIDGQKKVAVFTLLLTNNNKH